MIRRLIEMVLDKDSAKRVETDAQNALQKGTDPSRAERNLSRVGRSMDRLRGLAAKLGVALSVAFVANKIKNFGKESVRAANESSAIWNRLAGQLKIAGVEFSDVQGEIEGAARALQDATKVGDEDFAAIMTELVGTTNDYAASLKEVETVANLAAAKNISLETAAQLVGRAMVGQTGTLSRYGIIVGENADAMEVLRARFAGMARNEISEVEGKVAQLSNEWGDMQQAIGEAMLAAGNGAGVLDTLIGTVKGLTAWITENRRSIVLWGQFVVSTVKAVFESIRFVVRQVVNLGQVVVSGLGLVFLEARNRLTSSLNGLIEQINRIPGVNIEFRLNSLTPEEYRAESRRLRDAITRDTTDMADAVWDLGDAYRNLGRAAVEAATGQGEVAPVRVPGSGGPPIVPGVPGDEGESEDDRIARENERWLRRQEARRRELEAVAEFHARMREQAQGTADAMSAAFENYFVAIGAGFRGQQSILAATADAARGVGAAIVAGLVEGRAEEQMAQGTAKLAAGTWPPNPAAYAAAAKHFAAAALFRAIPGVIRGGGSGGSSGGSAASISRGAIANSAPSLRDPIGTEVHIYIDPLSPADPRYQRVTLGAIENAREIWGDNVSVNVHPRLGKGS